ncbi:helix-turn-helix domain-containing protein [Streptomyces angustmyceticus]|uniref:helix-turn-helix domain-containing protein n=1 Tax=Streptomyces angustmyceticus TaxID=285578 RepID=UPI0036AE7895
MPARKDVDGSLSVPSFYGAELRWQREAAGRTLQETVEGSFFAQSYLSEIERGTRRMPVELARHVDRVLETDGFFERRCEDVRNARQGAHAEYFAPIAEAETRARTIEEWSNFLVPGLLQTESYARAVIHSTHPLDSAKEVDAKIRARLQRAKLFDDAKRPEYWVILHESLVQDPSPLLPSSEMAEQLDRIAALGRRRRISPQVLPWNAQTRPFTGLSLMFVEFDDEPPVLYTEGPYHGQTIDDPGLVKQYRKAYDRLRAAALPPEASLDRIEEAAEDFRNGKQRQRLDRCRLA